ncbi:MAG: prepilin-type N-terminal cleavage/methylation domain-containing protein [Candidatus Dadabacteria bacterium]|nr:prepilin-type N-terminal cleavage/methylation domain-containing protein [Candidatus Dadabacteria bacterium]NIQ14047.1 prepilin-type N-terminal cleavage/methylation domain-containing protein [Candidatus Dadabacteria bacterium]
MKLISRLRDSEPGFTLIEILITVSISGVVLTLLYSSFFQVINAKDRIEEKNEVSHEVRLIFSRISRDLTNVYQRGKTYGSTTPKVPYFLGTIENDNSKLVFTSLARDTIFNKNQSDQTEISYYLVPVDKDETSEEKLFALVRKDNPFIGQEDKGIVFPISERVAIFNINFLNEQSFDDLGEGVQQEWDSSAVNSLPKAVEINLALRNNRGENEYFSQIISLPIAE